MVLEIGANNDETHATQVFHDNKLSRGNAVQMKPRTVDVKFST